MINTVTFLKSHFCGTLFLFLFFAIILGCDNEKDIEAANIFPTLQEGPLAIGCKDAVYDDWKTSAYVLPFRVGGSYEVNLSHCAGSYHSTGQPDQFAIDFEMPIGTTILASRAGRVVFVRESGEDGKHPNNLIVIGHDDNTFGQYMHLTEQGALVNVGDEIEQGQRIGLSGNTGLAGYPHLHFVVTAESYKYPYKSIPTTFKNTASNERSLASWTRYTALPYD